MSSCCVQCPICQKKIRYLANNANPLGLHMLKCHPTIQSVRFYSIPKQPIKYQRAIRFLLTLWLCIVFVNVSHLFTVKTWKPGFSDIYCPKCCQKMMPILRKQRKLTESSCGSMLVLGCWPLCFFPFVMDYFDENIINLYCPKCCNYLGTYSRKTGLILAGMRPKLPACPKSFPGNTKENNSCENVKHSSKLSQNSESDDHTTCSSHSYRSSIKSESTNNCSRSSRCFNKA